MDITHVWFDLGQTLVYTRRAAKYQKILEYYGIYKSEEEIEKAFHLSDKLFMREYSGILGKKAGIFIPWYYGVLNYKLGIEIDIENLCRYIISYNKDFTQKWEAFEFSRDVIVDLKNQGLKVGLISNWDESCRKVLTENNLIELLDTVIISSEQGHVKPSKEIFQYALNKSGSDFSKSLYVGDNYYDDVLGSSSVGMTCLLINPYEKLGIEEIDHPYIINDIREVKEFLKVVNEANTNYR